MRPWHYLVAALLILCLAVSPAAGAWTPPTDRSIVGVEWNASDPSPALRWIDVDGNTITPPDFNTHVIWGNVKKVLLTDGEVVIRDINPRGDNLDMSGASGKVPAVIHVSPEAQAGGPLARLRDGDWLELDARSGTLQVRVPDAEWQARTPARSSEPVRRGWGRELFAFARQQASSAEQGASCFTESLIQADGGEA